ncbi:hypothetical protein FACS189434_08040 [Bacteroidia bacterium]|nr:hypothetical protein FACS189434_08040 [Bacteroidia bacterium]
MPQRIEITPQFVESVIKTKHPNNAKCVELAEKIEIHAKGKMPVNLIDKRRPNESEQTKAYRKEIYVSITEEPIGKVINALSKIRRSQDWNIQYDNDAIPKSIAEKETLQEYCENNYPQFSSITNWAFSELLQLSLIDANAVCAVIVKSMPENSANYIKPEIEIFKSSQIINFVQGQYYALLSSDVYNGENNYTGKVYYIITDMQIARYEEQSAGSLVPAFVFNHNIGELPVQKVGGIYYERANNDMIQKSRIARMVPFLDEAVREYSDLQAEVVQHVHSEKYIYTNTECPHCKGHGILQEKNKDGSQKTCKHCIGRGKINNVSPYGEYLINVSKHKIEGGDIPAPPIGYVQKNTEVPRLQDERVEKHIYKSLSSVNMEFLAKTPLNQSGVAKEIDRDELDTFVNSVAEDIVMVLDCMYKFICDYRYSYIIPNREERRKMLPTIAVPERFGLLNSSVLMQEVQTAKAANANPIITKNLEVEYLRKKYNANPEIAEELELVFALDPFYGYSQQDKMTMFSNGGITETDYIISCNIVQFVERATQEDSEFTRKSFKDKKRKVAEYAADIIKENSAKMSLQNQIEEQIDIVE